MNDTTKKKIAVAGATGRVGRHVVEVLRERGHEAVSMSRATGVDVITGAGLAEALAGVDAIVDAATGPSPEQRAATEFFEASAANLQRVGAEAGVGRIVAISIIGIDGLRGGYSVAKVAHERALQAGPLPVTILRAAQFHEFVEQLVQWGTDGEVARVAQMRTQPIAARFVAEAAADLATAAAPPERAEVAGPREESLVALAERFVAGRLRIEPVHDAADPEPYENGGMLPGAGARLAGPTFDEWLAAHR